LQRADRSRGFLAGLFSASSPTLQAKGAGMTVVDFVSDAAQRLETELEGMPAEQGEIGVALAGVLVDLGKPVEALAVIDGVIARLRRIDQEGSVRLGVAKGRRAIALNQLSRPVEAEADANAALSLFEGLPGELALERIRVRTSLLVALTQQGRLENIVEQSLALLRDREALLGPDSPGLAVDWFNLGMAHVHADQLLQAVEAMRRSDQLLTASPDAPAARRAWVLNGLGGALRMLGELDASEQALAEAAEVGRRTLDEAHPMVLAAEHGMALIDFDRGEDPAAVAGRIRSGLDRLAADDRSHIRLSVDLSEVLLVAGKPSEARDVLLPVIERLAASAPADPQQLRARAYLALALAQLGDPAATRLASELADERDWPPGAPPRFRAEVTVQLAVAQATLGNPADAAAHARRAEERLGAVYREGHPRGSMLRQRLAAAVPTTDGAGSGIP